MSDIQEGLVLIKKTNIHIIKDPDTNKLACNFLLKNQFQKPDSTVKINLLTKLWRNWGSICSH